MEKPEQSNDFLAKWVDGTLSKEELREFKKSREYILYETILQGTKLLDAPKTDREKLFDKIQKEKQKEVKVKKLLIPKWIYAVAAGIALLLGYTFFLNQNKSYTTGYGEQLEITLPDGSEARLNAKATLYFKNRNWGANERTVFLDGEAFFKVKKGNTFTVVSGKRTVTVLGTQFNVIATSDFFEVGCYEGKVKVDNKISSKIITKGEGVRGDDTPLNELDVTKKMPSWVNGESNFTATPLKQVIIALEKQYNVTIRKEAIDQHQKFTGTFTHNNLEKALYTVFAAMNITFTFTDDTTIELYEK